MASWYFWHALIYKGFSVVVILPVDKHTDGLLDVSKNCSHTKKQVIRPLKSSAALTSLSTAPNPKSFLLKVTFEKFLHPFQICILSGIDLVTKDGIWWTCHQIVSGYGCTISKSKELFVIKHGPQHNNPCIHRLLARHEMNKNFIYPMQRSETILTTENNFQLTLAKSVFVKKKRIGERTVQQNIADGA